MISLLIIAFIVVVSYIAYRYGGALSLKGGREGYFSGPQDYLRPLVKPKNYNFFNCEDDCRAGYVNGDTLRACYRMCELFPTSRPDSPPVRIDVSAIG